MIKKQDGIRRQDKTADSLKPAYWVCQDPVNRISAKRLWAKGSKFVSLS